MIEFNIPEFEVIFTHIQAVLFRYRRDHGNEIIIPFVDWKFFLGVEQPMMIIQETLDDFDEINE